MSNLDFDGLDGALAGGAEGTPPAPPPPLPAPPDETAALPFVPLPESEPTFVELATQAHGRRIGSADILALDPPSAVLTQPWSWARLGAWLAGGCALISLVALAATLRHRDEPAAAAKPAAIVAAHAPQPTTATATATTMPRPVVTPLPPSTLPTPSTTPPPRAAEVDPVVVPARFEFRSATPDVDVDALVIIAQSLARLCAGPVVVTGHADARGSDTANREVALERAEAVASLLVARDFPRARLRVVSAGASEPIAPNARAAGRRENRRVSLSCSTTEGGEP